MAVTATLVFAKPNHLRFLIVATTGGGEQANILGLALQAAAVGGLIKTIMKVNSQGYGKVPAVTASTATTARALLMSDNAVSVVGDGIPTLLCSVQQRTGSGTITVDATGSVDDVNLPMLVVSAPGAGAASAYLDIEVPGSLGA